MTLVSLDGDNDDATNPEQSAEPASVASYWLPLATLVLACVAFTVWRRTYRRGQGLKVSEFSQELGVPSAPVRLSTDDNGPASHYFTHDNASTDSLPAHALGDIPTLGDHMHTIPASQAVHAAVATLTGPPYSGAVPPRPVSSTSINPRGKGERRFQMSADSLSSEERRTSPVTNLQQRGAFGIGEDVDDDSEGNDHPLAQSR